MVRVPLKTEIFLMTKGVDLICTVLFAGTDTFKLRNVKKRIYYENGKSQDILITRTLIIDRESVIGYSDIEDLISCETRIKKQNNIISVNKFKGN